MKSLNILFSLLFLLFINIAFSQDSLLNKQIFTKPFNLTSEYTERVLKRTGDTIKEIKVSNFFDCKSVIPISDSSFKLNHEKGNEIVLYKNVQEIIFKGKSKTREGILGGALTGAVSGFLITAVFGKQWFKGGNFSEGGAYVYFLIYESVLIAAGGIIGGIIGSSYNNIDYDISKYPSHAKKENVLSIFRKHQIKN
ncbi:MAG: hypothetical protein WC358_04220 [Ignavibacteria bacterium]|jgi:hypothetical protein